MILSRPRLAVVLCITAIIFSACSAPSSEQPTSNATPTSSAAKAGGTLIVGLPGEMLTSEPAFTNEGNATYVMLNVMERLVRLDESGTKILPSLAASWTTSSDGLVYTFKLRQGVKFHDGTDFNADAVKLNFDRWANFPAGPLQTFANRYPRVFGGFGKASNIESVQAADTSTVVIRLREPRTNFLVTLDYTPFSISSPKALKDGDADNPDLTKNNYARGGSPAMVGTGPFMFKEWVPGDHVTIVKNANYWGPKAYVDAVKFTKYVDDSAALNALQAGDVDMVELISPTSLRAVSSDSKLQVIRRSESCNIFNLSMNITHKPLDNKNIRLAVAYALDRQSYIDAFYAGMAVLADNFVPMTFPYAIPMNVPKYNPTKAKELIQQSGIAQPTIDFWYPSNVTRPYMPDPKGQFEAMTRDLEAVGFKVVPHTAGWTTGYLSEGNAGKYAMFLYGNTCAWPAIDYMWNVGYFGGGDPVTGIKTQTGYGSPELNRLLKAALSATPDQAAAAWRQVQEYVANDFPMVPLLNTLTPGAARAYVKGLTPSGALNEFLAPVWLDK